MIARGAGLFAGALIALGLSITQADPIAPNATPIGAPIPGAIELGAGTIVASDPRPYRGQGVHFAVDPDHLAEAAASAGVSLWNFRREAEYYWRFSDSKAEDYRFTALPPDMRGPRTAGSAAGPFAAHVYETAGAHTVRVEIWFRGALHIAQMAIEAREKPVAIRRIGVVDPEGDFDGAPRHGRAFVDIDEALSALEGGAIEVLLLRYGTVYSLDGTPDRNGLHRAGYTIRDGQRVDAFGDPADGLPTIRPVFGAGGLEAFRWRLEAFGDGETRRFAVTTSERDRLAVYVDGVRRRENIDYDAADETIAFRKPPAAGARILVFEIRGDGRLPTRNRDILTLRGEGAQLRNIALRGPYDPTAPGVFDPERLDTFEHAVLASAVRVRGKVRDATLFNVHVSGFRQSLRVIAKGDVLVVANCAFEEWYDYGVYASGVARMALIGSRVTQALGALNGPGAKSENLPGVANYADHGPVRAALTLQQVFNRSRFDSRTSWTAKRVGEVIAQPVLRLGSSNTPGMSYALSESHTTGGASIFGGGAPNKWITQARADLIHVQNNIFVLINTGFAFSASMNAFTSINNFYFLADTESDRNLTAFWGRRRGRNIVAEDVRLDPILSINDTFTFLRSRPKDTLTLARQMELAPSGLRNKVGETVAKTRTQSVTVPVSVPFVAGKSQFRWRVWRAPNGDPGQAQAYDTVADQSDAYMLAPNADKPRRASTVIVTLRAGTFAEGERVLLTREQVRAEPVEVGTGVVGSRRTSERFSPNNRAEPLRSPPPVFHNPLIAIEGEWEAFHFLDGDGAPNAPSDWRSARFSPMTDLFQPLPESPAVGRVTSVTRAARDLTRRIRPAVSTLGALEPASDLSAWRRFPAAPRGVSAAWREPVVDTVAALDESAVAVSIEDPGQPALSENDVTISFVTEQAGTRSSHSRSDAEDDTPVTVRAIVTWSHVASGRGVTETPSTPIRQ